MRLTQCVGISDSGSVYLIASSLTGSSPPPGAAIVAAGRRRAYTWWMRKICRALLGALVVAGTVPVPCDAAPAVPAAQVISPASSNVRVFSLAGNARGDLGIAWEGEDRQGYSRV